MHLRSPRDGEGALRRCPHNRAAAISLPRRDPARPPQRVRGDCGGRRLRRSPRAASASARCRRPACRSTGATTVRARARRSRSSATSTATGSATTRWKSRTPMPTARTRAIVLRVPRARGRGAGLARRGHRVVHDHRPRRRAAGFSVTGGDFNGDGRADIGIGAPMAMGPEPRRRGRRVHRLSARARRATSRPPSSTTRASRTTRSTRRRTRRSSSRYEGFQPNSHTGTAAAGVMPGCQWRRLRRSPAIGNARRQPAPARRRRRGRCLTASPRASTSTSPTCGRPATPTTSTSTFPTSLTTSTSAQRLGVSRTRPWLRPPTSRSARPSLDLNGKVDSGSVWIINGALRRPPAAAGRRSMRRVPGSASTP